MSDTLGKKFIFTRIAPDGMPYLGACHVSHSGLTAIHSALSNRNLRFDKLHVLGSKDGERNFSTYNKAWNVDRSIEDLRAEGYHFFNDDFNKLSDNITDEVIERGTEGGHTIKKTDFMSAFDQHFRFKTGLYLNVLYEKEITLDSNEAWGSTHYDNFREQVAFSFYDWVEKSVLTGKYSEHFKDFEMCNYNVEDEIKLMRDSRERISHFISRHSKELSSHLAHKLDKPVTISDVRAYVKLNIDNSKFTEIAYNSFSPAVKLAFSRSKYADEKVDFILDSIFLTSYPNLYAANYLPGFAHGKFDFAAYSVKMFNQQARDAGSKIEPMPSLTRYETKHLKTYISALEEALLSIPDNSERALNGRALLDEAEAGLKNILISTGQLKVEPEVNVTDFTRNGLEEYLSDNFSKEALIEILNDSNADLDVTDLIDEVIERFRDGDLELNGLDNTDFSLGTSFRP